VTAGLNLVCHSSLVQKLNLFFVLYLKEIQLIGLVCLVVVVAATTAVSLFTLSTITIIDNHDKIITAMLHSEFLDFFQYDKCLRNLYATNYSVQLAILLPANRTRNCRKT
jgi:hypothetical protein